MVYLEQNWFHYKPITFLYIGDKKKKEGFGVSSVRKVLAMQI